MRIVFSLSKALRTLGHIKRPPVKLSIAEQPSHSKEILMIIGFSIKILLSKLYTSYAFSLPGGSSFISDAMILNDQTNALGMN